MHLRQLLIAPLALLAACASQTIPFEKNDRPENPLNIQVWEYPAAEFPAMCMLMHVDGTLVFQGGFTFFNPSKWRIGSSPRELVVTLGGTAAFPNASAQDEIQRKSRTLQAVHQTRRELVFKISESPTDFLSIGGFDFLRANECSVR